MIFIRFHQISVNLPQFFKNCFTIYYVRFQLQCGVHIICILTIHQCRMVDSKAMSRFVDWQTDGTWKRKCSRGKGCKHPLRSPVPKSVSCQISAVAILIFKYIVGKIRKMWEMWEFWKYVGQNLQNVGNVNCMCSWLI